LKGNSILKRDEYARKNQDQVGIALCALGVAISSFLKPEVQATLSPEAHSAVSIVNDGAKILADHFFRLSLSRRVLITPALNLLAKNTVDAILVDDFLFGSSFGESLKKATSMEKASKDMIKTPLTISRDTHIRRRDEQGHRAATADHFSGADLGRGGPNQSGGNYCW